MYIIGDPVDHVALSREFYASFEGLPPGMVGMEVCEGLFTHLRSKKAIAPEYPVRHFSGIEQAVDTGKLGNVYWLPNPGNPADALAKVKSDMEPLLRLPQSGSLCPGALRPFRGLSANALAYFLLYCMFDTLNLYLDACNHSDSFFCGVLAAGFFYLDGTALDGHF